MKNLKVGQSFDVVRIEKEIWLFESDFIIGKTCLGIFDKTKPHGLMCKSNAHNHTNGFVYYLSGINKEYKPIGRLKITKLK